MRLETNRDNRYLTRKTEWVGYMETGKTNKENGSKEFTTLPNGLRDDLLLLSNQSRYLQTIKKLQVSKSMAMS